MSDNTPNFDAMTPEEIMAWMESLAKRQGASEGFTTAADLDVPEIDPSSVVIDEPGYVPPETSKSAKMGGKLPVSAPAAKPAAAPKPSERKPEPPAPAVAKPSAPPKSAVPVSPAAARPVETPPKPVEQPKPAAAELPLFEALKSVEPAPPLPKAEVASLSWLESLAADQSGGMPELDLSSLAADLTPTAPPPVPVTNPVDWLESLTQGQGAELPVATEPSDPIDWLESLARRQGVRDEELTTSADIDIPLPADLQIDGPGYTDYAFDVPASKPAEPAQPVMSAPFAGSPEAETSHDPAAWLDALASASSIKHVPEAQAMSDTEIQSALKRGEIIPQDQMEAWMNRQLEIGAQRPEPVMEQEEAPAIKAELPDWLLEQVGQPTQEEPQAVSSEKPALIEAILEPPPIATSEIPDWLQDDEPESNELDSIFAIADVPPQENIQETLGFTPEAAAMGQGDPWFEAFEQEYQEKRGGTIEAAPPVVSTPVTTSALEAATFEPETTLPEGIVEEVPDWLVGMVGEEAEAIPAEDIPDWLKQDIGGVLPVEPEPEPAIVSSMPDWLADVDIAAEEIPDWLTQSITSEQAAVITPVPAAAVVPAPPTAPAPVPARASPAPVPVQAAAIDIPGTLSRARSFASGNDLDNSLLHYEQLIRANAEIDSIVADVTALAEKFKNNAPVLRILGDGLMRQGKLQAALDTYRKALNQL